MSVDPRVFIRKVFPTAHRLLVNRALHTLGLIESENVLIVGSGYDPYRRLFKKTDGYFCLDIKLVHGVTDIVADTHSLPFAAESFDCLFASEVLEHLRSPDLFRNEAIRVLRKGGKLILTVPFLFHKHGDPYDYWRPTDYAIQELLKDFRRIEIKPLGNTFHVVSDLITTAFSPYPVFFPLRLFNHLLILLPQIEAGKMKSHAPSGYLVYAVK